MVGYNFNLTNYFKGYSPEKRFHTSAFAGLGVAQMNDSKNKYKSFRAEVGLQFEYAMLRNLSLFAEPYFSIVQDRYDNVATPGRFEYVGGVRAGLKVRPYVWKDFYDSFIALDNDAVMPTWYQRFFFGGSLGGYKSNTTGYYPDHNIWRDYQVYLGYRIGAMSSLRLMGSTQDSHESVTKKHKVSLELDYMLDLISPFTGYKNTHRWRLYGYGGLGATFVDETKGTAPTRENQFPDSRELLLTGGLSAHYFVTPQWSLFAEPWVGKVMTGNNKDVMGGLRVGAQYSMLGTHTYVPRFIRNEQDRELMQQWRQRPLSHVFYGGGLGLGTSVQDVYGDLSDGTNYIPFNLFVGYRFSPTQALRLHATYMQPSKSTLLVPKTQRLMGHVDYMLNLTNLSRGYNPQRHLTFSGFIGLGARPLAVRIGKQNHTKIAPMAIVGTQLDYRFRNGVSLYAEPWTSVAYHKNRPTYTFDYGVNAGVALNLDNAYMYGPRVGGTPSEHWLGDWRRHFFVGAGSGYSYIRSKGNNLNYLPMMAYVGYRFTPVQSLRLRGVYQKTMDSNDRSAILSGHLDYMLNLTNLFAGYQPDRRFEIQNFVGIGLGYHPDGRSFKQELAYMGTLGLQASLRVKNGLSVFIEPEVALYNGSYPSRSDVDVHANILAGLQLNFEPLHAYHPSFGEHSELWRPSVGERFFAGFGYGWLDLVNSQIGTTPMATLHLGYRVSPIHAWRLRGMFNYDNEAVSPRRRLSASLDYMFNLTNMLNAYDPARRFNLSGVLGLGIRYNEKDKAGQADKNGMIATKLGWQVTGGLNAAYTLTPGIDAFVEPTVGVAVGGLSPKQHRYMLGISGGLSMSMQTSKDAFKHTAATMSHQPFFEGALGWVMPLGTHASQNTHGLSLDGRIGTWLNSFLGLRASLVAQNYYYGDNYGSRANYRRDKAVGASASTNFLGRVEVLLNPLNLSEAGQLTANTRKWDWNIAFGGQAGLSHRKNQVGSGNDVSAPYGFTVSSQVLYRTTPFTALFIEPRYELLNAGFSRQKGMMLGGNDKLFTIQAGLRLQTATRQQRRQQEKMDSTRFVPHAFASLRVGGYRGMSFSKSSEGGRIAGMLTADLGYSFTPLHGLKLQLSASRLTNHANDHRYAFLDYGVLYQGNLTNMLTGRQVGRKLNVYGEVGPMLTSMVGHTKHAPHHRHFAAGAAAGLLATYRLSPQLSLSAEGLGQMMAAKAMLPGQSNLLNGLRINLTAGVQYNF